MSDQESRGGHWTDSMFDELYLSWGLDRIDADKTEAAAEFLRAHLNVDDGDTVFDQCCGVGRLSLPLARRGLRVVGVDVTGMYVETARRRAAEASLSCEFREGDARTLVLSPATDAAFCWFTSFGYGDREDDRRQFRCLHDSIRPGGTAIVDYLNLAMVMNRFHGTHVYRPFGDEIGAPLMLDEAEPDLEAGVMRSVWTFLLEGGRRERREVSVRMYLPWDIGELLRSCGFTDLVFFGNTAGEPLSMESRRCIVVARRPDGARNQATKRPGA